MKLFEKIFIVYGLVVILPLFFLCFYPVKIIEISRFELDNSTIEQGEDISYNFDYCKYRSATAVVKKFYAKKEAPTELEALQTILSGVEKGCGSLVDRKTSLPNDLPPGDYILILRTSYPPYRLLLPDIENRLEFTVVESSNTLTK
jgi:hypothetical protein